MVEFSGVRYDPDLLKHPFNPAKHVPLNPPNHVTATYHLGELCRARVHLFHIMRHFKLHVLLRLHKFMTAHAGTHCRAASLLLFSCTAGCV
jgi:hypothetical protein